MNDGTDNDDLQNALQVLRKGGVIVYPTDTVWGVGCDATNAAAVKRIFEIKKRSDSKAMISLVSDVDMLSKYVECIPEAAYQLMDVAVDPLTIIYDHPWGIVSELKAEDGSAAFRVTSDTFARGLCRGLRRPLVSTSANISGEKSPVSFGSISAEILGQVDYIVKTRRESIAGVKPSTVIKISDGNVIKIIRE
ncbi:MAG: threonylcarbamoyl-AMP synthase [Paramuribaculum sp.]|nr:threonylcarbamoyl-AMP synthase [Paramuribaculum sp.]